jgi:hypothetical protein
VSAAFTILITKVPPFFHRAIWREHQESNLAWQVNGLLPEPLGYAPTWWVELELNQRHPALQASALPAELSTHVAPPTHGQLYLSSRSCFPVVLDTPGPQPCGTYGACRAGQPLAAHPGFSPGQSLVRCALQFWWTGGDLNPQPPGSLVEVTGIEPASLGCKPRALPLSYTPTSNSLAHTTPFDWLFLGRVILSLPSVTVVFSTGTR